MANIENKEVIDHSYGIIPLKKIGTRWHVLLVQLHAGHWGYPKGHAEENETEIEAATRELFEETGLEVDVFYDHKPLIEKYSFKSGDTTIIKDVTYYIATVKGDLVKQAEEVKDLAWVSIDQAYGKITFSQAKQLLLEVARFTHGLP